MTKTTEQIVEAFFNGNYKKIGNSHVETVNGEGDYLCLHGNRIARRLDSAVYLNHCGWETSTTKERLNGVLEYLGRSDDRIYQAKSVWYWKGKEEFLPGWNEV